MPRMSSGDSRMAGTLTDGGSVVTLRAGRRSGPVPAYRSPAGSGFDLTAAYDAHAGELLGFAANALRDRGAAEDCVQETFLRAWRARERYDPARAGLRTWLYAIARNVVLDALRARQRRPAPVDTDVITDRPGEAPDPLDRLRVLEGLARLSREHREVVVAVHLVGMSYAELAASSGLPVATLRTRSFYALRAMRHHLDDTGGLT